MVQIFKFWQLENVVSRVKTFPPDSTFSTVIINHPDAQNMEATFVSFTFCVAPVQLIVKPLACFPHFLASGLHCYALSIKTASPQQPVSCCPVVSIQSDFYSVDRAIIFNIKTKPCKWLFVLLVPTLNSLTSLKTCVVHALPFLQTNHIIFLPWDVFNF